MSTIVTSYRDTAYAVRDSIAQIPDDAWDAPGLGDWNVRDLVGHTSRSLVTVIEYFARPADEEVVPSAAEYLIAVSGYAVDPAGVTERGRQAGRDLGDDPVGRFGSLVEEAVRIAEATDPDLVVPTFVGAMRASAYLPTRTFELCVHGLDLAAATGVPLELPEPALEEAVSLAAVSAARRGQGSEVLLALTGRQGLPPGFNVV